MGFLATIKVEYLEYPLVVYINDDELMKRPLYERMQFGWSYNYIRKYLKIEEYKIKSSVCQPLF